VIAQGLIGIDEYVSRCGHGWSVAEVTVQGRTILAAHCVRDRCAVIQVRDVCPRSLRTCVLNFSSSISQSLSVPRNVCPDAGVTCAYNASMSESRQLMHSYRDRLWRGGNRPSASAVDWLAVAELAVDRSFGLATHRNDVPCGRPVAI
jgi:hypothetical protein